MMHSADQATKPDPPRQARRAWYRLHVSTWIVALSAVSMLFFLNLPGQIVAEASSSMYPGGGSQMHCDEFRYQGWPWGFARHKLGPVKSGLQPFDSKHVWRWPDGRYEFLSGALAANIVGGIAIATVCALLAEKRRRGRNSVWQFRISEMLALTTLIAICFGWLVSRKNTYENNVAVLSQLARGVNPPQRIAHWQYGGAHWLRSIVGDRFPVWLDRLVQLRAKASDTHIVAEIQGLIDFTPTGDFGPDVIEQIVKIHGLQSLTLSNYSTWRGGDQAWNADAVETQLGQIAELKSLTHLSLHNLYVRPSAYNVLLRMPQLKELVLSHASDSSVNDKTLDYLESLRNLELLSLHGTNVTSKGLAKLLHMQKLKWIQLDRTDIDDSCVDYLTQLPNLRSIVLDGTGVKGEEFEKLSQLRYLKALALPHTAKEKKAELSALLPHVDIY